MMEDDEYEKYDSIIEEKYGVNIEDLLVSNGQVGYIHENESDHSDIYSFETKFIALDDEDQELLTEKKLI